MRSAAISLFIGHSLPDPRLGFQRIHGRELVYTTSTFAKAEHNAASLIGRRLARRRSAASAPRGHRSDGILQPGSERAAPELTGLLGASSCRRTFPARAQWIDKENLASHPNGGFQDRAVCASLSKAAQRDMPKSRSFQGAALVLSAGEHSGNSYWAQARVDRGLFSY